MRMSLFQEDIYRDIMLKGDVRGLKRHMGSSQQRVVNIEGI